VVPHSAQVAAINDSKRWQPWGVLSRGAARQYAGMKKIPGPARPYTCTSWMAS